MSDLTSTFRGLLDRVLTDGGAMARRGEDMAARRLGVGDDPDSRRAMRNTALASGAVAGLAGLLLGSRGGRRLAGRGAMIGGLGLLGKVAWDAWQDGKSRGSAPAGAEPIHLLTDESAERRARTLTLALISAAKADGHVDAAEREAIESQMADLPDGLRAAMTGALLGPADAAAVAREAESDQERRELYAASVLICGKDHPEEARYLADLAAALRLPPDQVAAIEGSILTAVPPPPPPA